MRDFVSKFQPDHIHLKFAKELQSDAQKFVLGMSFPTTKDEAWKYTGLNKFSQLNFHTPTSENVIPHEFFDEHRLDNSYELIFINGKVLLSKDNIDGVSISNLYESFQENHLGLKEKLRVKPDLFSCLNQAYSTSGILIEITQDIRLPLHIINIISEDKVASFPSIFVHLAQNANATIVESNISLSDTVVGFHNSALDINVSENAKLNYVRLDRQNLKSYSFFTSNLKVSKFSELKLFFYNSGSKLSRHSSQIDIVGEGADVQLGAIYLNRSDQLLDHYIRVNHLVPSSSSSQTFKGVLNHNSKMIFNSTIFVDKIAQLTKATQLNQSILLNNKAEVDTRPQLLIYADDVKCAHGATVGALNADELFYLQSRGFSPEKAKEFLTLGFLKNLMEDQVSRSIFGYVYELMIKDFKNVMMDDHE